MRNNLSVCFFLLFFAGAFAQNAERSNNFQPGWSIGAGGGFNIYIAEGNGFWEIGKHTVCSYKENAGYIGTISLGYQLSPIVGMRGNFSVMQHSWPDVRYTNTDGSYRVMLFNAEDLSMDMMINLSSCLAGYNPRRWVNVSIFGGFGLAYRNKDAQYSSLFSPIVRFGGQMDVRLSHKLDLNLCVQNNFVRDNFNDYVKCTPFELYSAYIVGLTYHLNN